MTKKIRGSEAGPQSRGTGKSGHERETSGRLRLGRDLARLCLDIAGILLLALDRSGNVIFINRKGCQILGMPENEILGRNWFDNFLPADVRDGVRKMFPKYLAEGGPEHHENTVLTRSGAERLIAWHNTTLRNGSGKAIGTLSSGEDVTYRRQAAEKEAMQTVRFEALLQLNRKMNAPEKEIVDFCLEASLNISQSELSFIGLMDHNETALTIHAWSKTAMAQCSMEEKPRRYAVENAGLWGECVRQRKPLIVNDYSQPNPGKKGCPAGHVPLRRLLCVPVFDGEKIAAVVAAANKERAYDEEDVRSLEVLMNKMWKLLRLRRMEAALSQGEKRYRELVDNAVAGVVTTDIEGRVTFANRALSDGLGFLPEELVGKPFTDFLHPEDIGKILVMLQGAGKARAKDAHIEFRVFHKDGHVIHCYTSPTISYLDGEIAGFNAIIYDISERKRAEAALRESEEKYKDLVENINDVIFSVDKEGTLTYISPVIQRVLGMAPEQITGRPFTDFVHPEDLAFVKTQFAKVMRGHIEPSEYRLVTATGEVRQVRTSSRPVRLPGGLTGMTGTLNDITDRRLSDEALKTSEQRFRLLAENAQDMIYRVRLQPRLAVEYVSPSSLAITGYTPEEYYAGPVLGFGLIPFEGHPEQEGMAWAKEALGKPRTMRWQRKDGGSAWLELVNHPVLNGSGQLLAVEGVARDITARKNVEDALRESEEKFRDLAEQSPNMIFINVKGRIVYANQRCEEVMGYTREEFYSPGFDFTSLIAPEHRALIAEKYGSHLSGRDVAPYEYAIVTRGGKRIEAILSTKLINYGGEPGLLGTITDITERKSAEKALGESEEKYRQLFESAPQGIVTLDLEGKVMEVNAAGLKIMNLRREEVVGRFFADIPGAGSADLPGLTEQFTRFLQGETVDRLEIRIRTPQGDVWQEIFPAILDKDGEPQSIQIIMRDITESKLADEKVRASLREKEVLLKEIHHRVKNNLQIVHSLLNMQARKDRDGRVVDALRESQNRVRTMALIHERLYRSTNLSEIDYKEYITRLVGELYSSFGADADQIRLGMELEDVKLGIDCAIPCGFIVNELVSNALKHGFPGGRPGRLRLALSRGRDGTVGLAVGDDGAGLPEGLDFRKTETLGLQLVCALVDQLRGTIELDRANGTEFRIVFNPVKQEGD